MIPQDIISKIETAMLEALSKYEKLFGKAPPIPKLVFKRLPGRTLAREVHHLRYNSPMAMMMPGRQRKKFATLALDKGFTVIVHVDHLKDNLQKILDVAIPHEVAHVAALFYYGLNDGGGHGRRWKEMMVAIGQAPERLIDGRELDYSNIEIRTRQVRYFGYRCNCPDKLHRISSVCHNRYQSGGYTHFGCKRCGANLRYAGEFTK